MEQINIAVSKEIERQGKFGAAYKRSVRVNSLQVAENLGYKCIQRKVVHIKKSKPDRHRLRVTLEAVKLDVAALKKGLGSQKA